MLYKVCHATKFISFIYKSFFCFNIINTNKYSMIDSSLQTRDKVEFSLTIKNFLQAWTYLLSCIYKSMRSLVVFEL